MSDDLVAPPDVPGHTAQAIMRLTGQSWGDIDSYHQRAFSDGVTMGNAPEDMNKHLGFPGPAQAIDALHAHVAGLSTEPNFTASLTMAPETELKPADHQMLVGGALRQAYAQALTDGSAKDAGDFSQRYTGLLAAQTGDPTTGEVDPAVQARAGEVAGQIAKALPSHQDATDYAIGLTQAADIPLTPQTIANTRANLLDQWSFGDAPLGDVYSAAMADPGSLANPRMQRPLNDDLAGALSWVKGRVGEGFGSLARIVGETTAGVNDAYENPLGGGRDDWGVTGKDDNPAKVLAYIAAKDIDALARVPTAAMQGIARGGAQILKEAGMRGDWADTAMRDAIALSVAVGAKESPMRVRTFDPLNPAAEAVKETSATAAYVPDVALHEQARAVADGKVPPPIFDLAEAGETHAAHVQGLEDNFAPAAGSREEAYGPRYTPPVMENGKIRLYRGEPEEAPAVGANGRGQWFTPNAAKAARYGEVTYLDITPDELSVNFDHKSGYVRNKRGDEYTTINPEFLDRNTRTNVALHEAARGVADGEVIEPREKLTANWDPAEMAGFGSQASVETQRLAYIGKHVSVGKNNIRPSFGSGLSTVVETDGDITFVKSLGEIYATDKPIVEKSDGSISLQNVIGVVKTAREKGERVLDHVVVSPDLQGRGIGTKLLGHAERELPDLHMDRTTGLVSEAGAGVINKYNAGREAAVDPKAVEELAKGYNAAEAVWSKLSEMHAGISVPNAWLGVQQLFRGPEGMINAAAKAAANEYGQGLIRKYRGMSDREITAHFNSVEEFRSQINEHMPEYEQWVRAGMLRDQANKPLIANLIDHIEGRSVGVALDPNSPFAPLADALRSIHEGLRSEIETQFPDMTGFHEDYYRHLWTDAKAAEGIPGAGRQGSSGSLRERVIPTISRGLELGLTPKILDPIENTLHYAAGMSRYIAARRILDDAREAGYVKYSTKATVDFPTQINGVAATLPAGENGIQRAYAAPGFGAPYNNWLGRGFYDHELGGKIYGGLQYVSNIFTATKLAWWGYHAFNIAKETGAAQLTNGLGEIMRGDLVEGLKHMGYGAGVLPGAVDYLARGAAFQKKYLDLQNNDPVVQILTEAGFNPLGRRQRYEGPVTSPDIQAAARGASYMQMVRRGQIWDTLRREIQHIGGEPEDAAGYRAVMAGPRAAGFMINQIARVFDAINAPVFDAIIPKIKTGAAAAELEAFIRGNPATPRDQLVAAARKISDSMDDRFGEMNQDNLFWPRMIKQLLNVAVVSVGWEYGTVRAFGGAAKDWFNGDVNSTRARWLIAYPAMMSMMNSLYQYLRTGSAPWQTSTPMRDLITPRTGGAYANRYGTVPERAVLPGYEKDVMQTYKTFRNVPDFTRIPGNMVDQAMGKLNPFWQSIRTTLSGVDPIGNQIYHMPDPPFQTWGMHPGVANWLRFMGDQLRPIVAGNALDQKPGSNIPAIERVFGIRPAGGFFQNEPGAIEGMEHHERTLDKQQRRRTAREANQ